MDDARGKLYLAEFAAWLASFRMRRAPLAWPLRGISDISWVCRLVLSNAQHPDSHNRQSSPHPGWEISNLLISSPHFKSRLFPSCFFSQRNKNRPFLPSQAGVKPLGTLFGKMIDDFANTLRLDASHDQVNSNVSLFFNDWIDVFAFFRDLLLCLHRAAVGFWFLTYKLNTNRIKMFPFHAEKRGKDLTWSHLILQINLYN